MRTMTPWGSLEAPTQSHQAEGHTAYPATSVLCCNQVVYVLHRDGSRTLARVDETQGCWVKVYYDHGRTPVWVFEGDQALSELGDE